MRNELDYDVNEYGKRYGDASDSLRYCHKGLLTGSVTAILGTDKCLYKTLYYDKYQRCIQIQSINHLGERESDAYSYSYTGQVLMRHHTISSPGAASMEEYYEYNYDHAGRLTDVQYDPVQIGADSTVDIESAHLVDIRYDKLGRLETVIHHDGWGDVISYDYNIRDWTTHLDGKHFEQTLQYESSSHRVTPCFNGNISCMIWNTDSLTRGYKYFYDGHNRLMNALYAEGDSLKQNVGRFDEEITGYDKLGNILGLKRFGQTTETEYGLIDNLTLTYDGNQLASVVDSVVTPSYIGNFEFRDGANLPVEYLYDLNGNLIQDLNKNIVDIQYNCLNLPSRIQFGDGNFISYLYSSRGTKLRSSHCIGGDTLTTDYCGNAIYENGVLTKLLNDYGYLSLSGDATYHYFIRDYQGNVRAVVTSEGEVEEINHYYPFGGTFASSVGSVQPYKYNGKELDRKGGLDWYDYGARHYDAALGRWHAVDPMAEKYYEITPYGYCLNNPLNRIDPDGKQVIPVPMPYAPLPFYSPITYPQSYHLPSDQQIMRHASGKFAEVGQIITDIPWMSYAFGTLLYYQAKNAISPEYEHQRNRERKSKEELDRNQANIARSIDTNVSGMMPNGDPAPKRKPKGWRGTILKIGLVSAMIEDYYNNLLAELN